MLLLWGLAGGILVFHPDEAAAQAKDLPALRVDPQLLGLPPVKREAPPAPEARPAPDAKATQPGAAEVKPVDKAVVEQRPMPESQAKSPGKPEAPAAQPASPAPASTAASAPAQAAAPSSAAAPAVSAAVPASTAAPSVPTRPAPVAAPLAPATKPAVSAPVARDDKPTGNVKSLTALRVDPALLGLPPSAAAAVAAAPLPPSIPERHLPPQVAPTGPRDEEEVPDVGVELALRASKQMAPPETGSNVPLPVFLSSHRLSGAVDRELVAEGEAELRRAGTALSADRLTYWPIEDEIEAEGSVRLEQGDALISGPKMRLRIEDQFGYVDQPSYSLKREPKPVQLTPGAPTPLYAQAKAPSTTGAQAAVPWITGMPVATVKANKDATRMPQTATLIHGQAERMDFEGENHYRLTKATMTTCSPGEEDWYIKADELKLDYDREVGEGAEGTVYFLNTPILYSPWLSFSLNNQRKSGFLAPSYASSTVSGVELTLPYYWNIAPNMDDTVTARYIGKRGLQLGNEFRYLDRALGGLYRGELRTEWLPDDNVLGKDRYGISWRHTQTSAYGLGASVNYNKVSDDTYFTELASRSAITSTTQLLQQGILTYGGGWWGASANFQQYQTLQPDAKNPVLEQYRMLPQLTFNARKPDFFNTDSSFLGQYTSFTKPDQIINGTRVSSPDGQRFVLYPQVALPYVQPGWYVTPKFGVNYRSYSLSNVDAGIPTSQDVTLPVFSVDSGMTFERTHEFFGRSYTQTLEPRLYYVYVPYKNQDQIPIFDTALADFNFAQIFSENQFSGWDRFSNANQLTAGLTTRLLDPATGAETLRAMVGQRYYFERNRVGMPNTVVTTSSEDNWRKSDFLAAFSGRILQHLYADVALQYNPSDAEMARYSVGARYQPEPGKVFNAAYRFNRDKTAPVDQVDLSAQWPIYGRWYGVGRFNYSFKDDGTVLTTGGTQSGRMVEGIAGLEYNGGCWVVRAVVRRQALTADKESTAFYVQLELNDLARIGSNPLSLLSRSIQGYGLVNQSYGDPDAGIE